MNVFHSLDSHRPLCLLASPLRAESVEAMVRRAALCGFGGVCATWNAAIEADVWRALDEACSASALEWHLTIAPSAQSPALVSVVRDAAAGGAAGVWRALQNERDWIFARAVPLEDRGAVWNQSLDLKENAKPLDLWNGRARIFAFAREMQSGCWPSPEAAQSVASVIATVAAAKRRKAWRGVLLQLFDSAPPPFPYFENIQKPARDDWAQTLISLVADTGEKAVARRLAFWDAAFRSAAETFWKPLRALCDEQKIAFSVAVEAENLAAQTARWGENLRLYPDSVAVVARGESENAMPTLRALASQSELDGKTAPSVFCLAPQSDSLVGEAFVAGAARIYKEIPPHRSPDAVRAHNEYRARMGALAAMKSAARVALVLPRSSFLAHYNPRAHRYVRWVEDDFRRAADSLDTLHFSYLHLEDSELENATVQQSTVENGRTLLLCGAAQHAFEMVVLPSVTTLSRAAWAKLESFVAAGGKVVCLGLLPRWSEVGRDAQLETGIGRATMMVLADLYDAYAKADTGAHVQIEVQDDDIVSGVGYPIARSNDAGGRLSCYQPRLNRDAEDARLRVRGLLQDSLAPDMQSQSARLCCARRANDDGQWWLLALRDAHATRASARLQPATPGAPFYASPQNGTLEPVREWMSLSEIEGDGLVIPLDLAGHEARALCWKEGAAEWHVERANFCLDHVDETRFAGYALHGGAPFVAWQKGEKLISRQGEETVIPAPMLLEHSEDETNEDEAHDDEVEIFRVSIPDAWQDCRVFLELAHAAAPIEIEIGGKNAGVLVAPPWKLDITSHVAPGETEIRIAGAGEIIARLAAYPRLEIAR